MRAGQGKPCVLDQLASTEDRWVLKVQGGDGGVCDVLLWGGNIKA